MLISIVSVAVIISAVIGYRCGRSDERARIAKARREAERDSVEYPDALLFADVVGPSRNGYKGTYVCCPMCDSGTQFTNSERGRFPLCGCVDRDYPHFHIRCFACLCRFIVRNKSDVDKPVASVKVTPSVDKNLCECGADDARTDVMPDSTPAWRCMTCDKLRPKLVGGVTPLNTSSPS